MGSKNPNIKKYISVLSALIILALLLVKTIKPDFYNRYFNVEPVAKQPATENSNSNTDSNNPNKCSGKQTCAAKVTAIVDGDTIDLSTGEKVRYIGVDTPETKHPIKKVECFGKESSEKNKELVLDKEVRLEKDVSDKDRYDRLLRYVYIDDLFVNDYLARNGFAHAATFPPDVKFSEQFMEAEREARENQRGLWAPGICP